MVAYRYDECVTDTKAIIGQLTQRYDAIIAISRGGLSFAHLLASGLDLRTVHTINAASYDESVQREDVTIEALPDLSACSRVLIAEDIIDSGKSMLAVTKLLQRSYPAIRYEVAALFYKKSALFKPDFYAREATEWVRFCWEIEPLR